MKTRKGGYYTQAEKEQLEDFKLGQIDILNWLKRQFELELCELNQFITFEIDQDQFLCAKMKKKIFEHYLKQINNMKEDLKK